VSALTGQRSHFAKPQLARNDAADDTANRLHHAGPGLLTMTRLLGSQSCWYSPRAQYSNFEIGIDPFVSCPGDGISITVEYESRGGPPKTPRHVGVTVSKNAGL
jgi:hypothetical protein